MNKFFKYLSKNYFSKRKTFIIAEIGTNHNQDIKLAKKMILKAKNSGADAVKFQMLNFEEQYFSKHYSEKFANNFKKLEFKDSWFNNLKKYCKKKKIIFFASPTYKKSALNLIKRNDLIKIASPQFATDDYLTNLVIKSNKSCILSNGLLSLKETRKKIKKFYKINKNIMLLYCISRYPTKLNELNLINIKHLTETLPCPIGFSDHTTSTDVPVYAISLGAKIIEKHITINNKSKGPDHKFALEIDKFKLMVKKIRNFEKSIGKINKNLNRYEKKIIRSYTPRVISDVLIKKNQKITPNKIIFKRAKKGFGYSAQIKNYVAKRNIHKNEIILKKNLTRRK